MSEGLKETLKEAAADKIAAPTVRSVNDYPSAKSLRDALGRHECPIACDENEAEMDWIQTRADPEKSYEQTLEREMERLLVLKGYLDLDPDSLIQRNSTFERLTNIAKRTFQVPMCVIFLLDIGRSWALTEAGQPFNLVPRKDTFCSHVIVSEEDCFVVPNALEDPRFQNSDFVKNEGGVRFYAASPLRAPEGYNIGTFCLVDVKPRPALSEEERETLKDLAKLSMDALVQQRAQVQQKKELEEASKRFASASHDLLTPLSAVQLSIALLNEDSSFAHRMSEHHKECLSTITSCSAAMGGICKDLKIKNRCTEALMNKLQGVSNGSSTSVSPETVSSSFIAPSRIVCYTRKLVERLQVVMERIPKRVPLSIQVAPDVPDVFVGNELQLFQIALHVLVNACERTLQGSVHMQLSINEQGACGQRALVFECTDTATLNTTATVTTTSSSNMGEPADIFNDKVLSSFSHSEATRQHDDGDETGRRSPDGILSSYAAAYSHDLEALDLQSFSNQIRSLGGDYGAEHLLAKTRYWFSIPVFAPSNSDQVRETHVHSAFNSPSFAEKQPGQLVKTALVIDDSVVMRKMLVRALSQLGYTTQQAADGLEGLQRMQESTFDLVLLDYLMPIMDGMDCVREYREWEKKHRAGIQCIVGMSAHASGNDVDRALHLGMNAYRAKPLTLDDLRQLEDIEAAVANISLGEEQPTFTTPLPGGSVDRNIKRRRRSFNLDDQSGEKVCLIATGDSADASAIEDVVKEHGWTAFVTNNGDEALQLLKRRNWGAVFLDSTIPDLPDHSCISQFRTWEKQNRVRRQKNVLIMADCPTSTSDIHNVEKSLSILQLPTGFDAAIKKPANQDDLALIFQNLSEPSRFDAEDIVTG
jgi:CheY-like chemotaxis protein